MTLKNQEEEYKGNTKCNEWHGGNLKKGIEELSITKQGQSWSG